MNPVTRFSPGSIIHARRRLWRINARQGDALTATAIDGQTEQVQFYLPFEDIQPGELPLPSPKRVGTNQAQQLLLRAYRLRMLHGTTPLLSLQRSRVVPKDYQLVQVVMSLEMPRVRLLLADKNQILEVAWDALLIDEAHQSNPDQRVKMDRHELTHLPVPRVRYLLLTAAPHNGYSDSFACMLNLLDVEAVQGPAHPPAIIRAVGRRHRCQRPRQDLETWFADAPNRSPFPERDQEEVIVSPTAYEMDAIRAVEAYGEKVLQQAAAGSARVRTLAHWRVLHPHKRALSSPKALRRPLKNRRGGLQSRLEQELIEVSILVDVARANALDEDTGERLDEEEAGFRMERTPFGEVKPIAAELEQVLALAQKVTPRRDAKLQKLLDTVLAGRLRQHPKVVVFSRYLDTLEYLASQIGQDKRHAETEVLTIHGGLNERQHREVFSALDRAKKAVLVTTCPMTAALPTQYSDSHVVGNARGVTRGPGHRVVTRSFRQVVKACPQ